MVNKRKGGIETRLEWGIEAAKAGENERARDILVHVIELDQYNEQAWLWLSAVVETVVDKRVCLENVLFINPDNAQAAAELRRLRQSPGDRSTQTPAFPRLAVSRALAGWAEEEDEDEEDKQPVPSVAASLKSAGQVCSLCGYRNPGWVYVCDRCGADLRPVDLREVVSAGSRPRGRNFATLLEAWGGVFIFNRLLAFQPEVALASWGRSLAALVMAAFFVSVWRAIIAVAPHLTPVTVGSVRRAVFAAFRCAVETLPSASLLVLNCVPVAILTWLGARLAGGRQGFKTHAHLTAVAFSAWVVLIALLASILSFTSYPPDTEDLLRLLFGSNRGVMLSVVSVAVGLIGVVWLMQAVRTAHRLSIMHTLLTAFLAAALSIAFLFGLSELLGGWLVRFGRILVVPFTPWPD
jgi:hypothetical protein